MAKPRPYTQEEVRDRLLDHLRALAKYWADLPDIDPRTGEVLTHKSRCDGLIFSVLSTLDGCSFELPAMALVLRPHPDDAVFQHENGDNWFEPGMEIDDMLHELYYHPKEPQAK